LQIYHGLKLFDYSFSQSSRKDDTQKSSLHQHSV